MKYLILLLLCAPVFADQAVIQTDGKLTEAQKAALAVEAAKMISDNGDNGTVAQAVSTPSKLKEWADVGAAIGTGLAASAKELGLAANDFAKSPVGRFTMFLIAWHFLGGMIVHVAFGIIWFAGVIPIWLWMYRRTAFKTTVTVYEKDKGPGGVTKVSIREPLIWSDDYKAGTVFTGAISILWVALLFSVIIGVFGFFAW